MIMTPLNQYRATPIKCVDLDDTDRQLKLEGWLYVVVVFIPFIYEEAAFYREFGGGGSIFIGNSEEEAPYY